jgi:hypothetical protein
MMVLVGSWVFDFSAGAFEFNKDTFAAESTSAVVSKFGGLVQPEVEIILFARLLLVLF